MSSREVFAFPKVELHRHLEGSIRLSTLKEQYLKQHEGKVPEDKKNDDQYWRNFFLMEDQLKDLTAALDKFWATQSVISDPEMVERITYEVCEDAYNEGIRILELRYSPSYIQHFHHDKLSTISLIHDAVLKGVARAKSTYKMAIGLIGIIDRNLSFEQAEHTMNFFIENKKTLVGVDLANDEILFDSKPFAPLFQKAKQAGLHVTIHAGESLTPGTAQKVKDAIDLLGAERIGHGIAIATDKSIMEYVKQKGVVLEICPTSNWLISAIQNIEEHPVRKLVDEGVKVTISSDDPGLFNINLTHEYEVLRSKLHFTDEELRKLNQCAFEHSFIDKEEREKYFHL